ncbi:serine/threonine protein kinase [Aciduricibacillus chroicocephali]|uniref:Serine/threonine protein kinase n=1 Tax=Aciduricibacillus chroicocephali TaxID=3054939 RepID=A0ABY9KYN1_9BACI|nr:serine/threonine protein kinase [Bacillaceae bacterium 44XB]
MEEESVIAERHLPPIYISSNPNNRAVSIHGFPSHLRCIGIGTDAAVFQSIDHPSLVYKVYANDKTEKVEIEAKVYELLGESTYFSRCFGYEDNYLILKFEEGITLYDCLLKGIPIPKQVIEDVDRAREYARQKGLNPRDIHLKNILLQNGRAKLIDVSEYIQPGNDLRWEHLKKGYDIYYPLIKGRPLPHSIIETIRNRYYNESKQSLAFERIMEYTARILKRYGNS